jgi:hypothetical protein
VAQTAPAANPADAAKPQTVKKRICEMIEEDPSSRLGNRKICKTVEVPVDQTSGKSQNGAQAPATGVGTSNKL